MVRRNRYANKRRHKRKIQEKYTKVYDSRYSVRGLRQKLEREAEEWKDSWWMVKHPPRNKGWQYWQLMYLTGRRQFAKKYSDKRIRQKYRIMIAKEDPEDVTAPRGADYEKEFDYSWTIW